MIGWLLVFYVVATYKVMSLGNRFVTVHTHGDFIVLPPWEIGSPALLPHIPLSHIVLTLSQPVVALSY